MLTDQKTYTTIPVSDLDRARKFYGETLVVAAVMVTEGGIMYGGGGTQFFVYPSRSKASGGPSQMSWIVRDIKAEVAELRAKGIKFEEYDIPGLEMVDGIAHSGPSVWTAYFRDPDGNLLGLTQIG
jgi:catechol 2,3-dioxygenase-like lactoylglutathione lyase family enzyme